jgi:hypothetical protein
VSDWIGDLADDVAWFFHQCFETFRVGDDGLSGRQRRKLARRYARGPAAKPSPERVHEIKAQLQRKTFDE